MLRPTRIWRALYWVAAILLIASAAACFGDGESEPEVRPTPVAVEETPTATPVVADPTPRPSPTAIATPTLTATPTTTPTTTPTATATPAATATAAPTATPAPTATATTTATAPRVATPEPTTAPASTAATTSKDGDESDAALADEAPGVGGDEVESEPSMDDGGGRGGDGYEAHSDGMDDGDGAAARASGSSSGGGSETRRTALSAGEVNDNELWDEYLLYRREYTGDPVHDVDVSERYVITVTDADSRPVHNARVTVSSGETALFEGRTYANGQTLFFPIAFPESEGVESFTLRVARGAVSEEIEFDRGGTRNWDVTLDVGQAVPEGGVPLDILFLLDATGSMADEIGQIKDTLLSIASRISALPSEPDLRLGMVAYRDRGDDFVTRVFDFEPDAQRFLETIRSVVAEGGDDYPESLNEALHVAVHQPEWRDGDAIRLMFLIADAPPHLDFPDDYSYADEMIEAHRRGIKIFSIASSGLNPQGEYVFRQIAQHTMGRFIFIVYGAGGTTPHNVSRYTVEQLDDLVVSLVEEELAFLDQ